MNALLNENFLTLAVLAGGFFLAVFAMWTVYRLPGLETKSSEAPRNYTTGSKAGHHHEPVRWRMRLGHEPR